jgi:hypothetical protein
MRSIPAFDTHAYYQQLTKAGFTSDQAEIQIRLQTDLLSSLTTEKLATKDDISELKEDIVKLKASTNQDIAGLKQDMIEFKAEIKQDMTEFKTEIKKDVSRLENKISSTDYKLSWLLALTGSFGSILTALQLILHFCHT